MAIIEVAARDGGDDAADKARRLADALEARAGRLGAPVERADAARVITLSLPRHPAAGWLQLAGVHKFLSVPSGARRMTSVVLVSVRDDDGPGGVPDIPASDLKVETFKGHGPGGQSRNTTDSAVRITHLPTGLQEFSQNERSQYQNRVSALAKLARRMAEQAGQEQAGQVNAIRRAQAAPATAYTHRAWHDKVTRHADGCTWSLRTWAQGRFD